MKHTVVSTIAFVPAYLYNKKYTIFLNYLLQVLALKVWKIKLKKGAKRSTRNNEEKSLEIPKNFVYDKMRYSGK